MNRVQLALALSDVVSRTEGVARLDSGFVEASTQYAGGKVSGISISAERIDVHLVLDELPVATVVTRVRRAAARVLLAADEQRRLRIVVADVDIDCLTGAGRR